MLREYAAPFAHEPRTAERIFFALKPDDAAISAIEALRRRWRAEGRGGGSEVLAQHLHVTLLAFHVMAPVPEGLIDHVRRTAARVLASPFDVAFDRVNRVGGWVSLAGRAAGVGRIRILRDAVREAAVRAGFGRMLESPPDPHMTLLYRNEDMSPHPIEPIGWTVGDFTLIQSFIGQTRHRERDRWALKGLS